MKSKLANHSTVYLDKRPRRYTFNKIYRGEWSERTNQPGERHGFMPVVISHYTHFVPSQCNLRQPIRRICICLQIFGALVTKNNEPVLRRAAQQRGWCGQRLIRTLGVPLTDLNAFGHDSLSVRLGAGLIIELFTGRRTICAYIWFACSVLCRANANCHSDLILQLAWNCVLALISMWDSAI
jgi:hypothetical protein